MPTLQELGAETPDPEFNAFADPRAASLARQALQLVSGYHGFVYSALRKTGAGPDEGARGFIAGCFELPHICAAGDSPQAALGALLDLALDHALTTSSRLPSPLPEEVIPEDAPGQAGNDWLAAMRTLGRLDPPHTYSFPDYISRVRQVLQDEAALPGLALLVECCVQATRGYEHWTLSALLDKEAAPGSDVL